MTTVNFNNFSFLGESILQSLKKIENSESKDRFPGFLVVIDRNKKVIGSVTDGDIRRGLISGLQTSDSIERVMNTSPLLVKDTMTQEKILGLVAHIKLSAFRDHHRLPLIVVNDTGNFVDLVYMNDFVRASLVIERVAVYGMGYVGLTLAVAFANAGVNVIGIDKSNNLLKTLQSGKPSFYEINFTDQFNQSIKSGKLTFCNINEKVESPFRIITVGTPIDNNNNPDTDAIISVTRSIARDLTQGDLVTYRSTLPIGTTSNLLIPLLEKESKLRVGRDFSVSFAPERTIEGNAMKELSLLPQVVGGYDDKSGKLTSNLYKKITQTIVEVDSIESAELVKLINNSYRDHVFAFSNELALLCNSINIDPYRIIQAANEGYPRNPIPFPSPGVGGACLSKDPYLYANSKIKNVYKMEIPQQCRVVHNKTIQLVSKQLERFAYDSSKILSDITIICVGMAFKGEPVTSDLRDSSGVKIAYSLSKKVKKQYLFDFAANLDSLNDIGIPVLEKLNSILEEVDAILFLNNHQDNSEINFLEIFSKDQKQRLIFDGWNQFSRTLIESTGTLKYANLGYYTNFSN